MLKEVKYIILVVGILLQNVLRSQNCDTAAVSSLIKKSYHLNTNKPDSALKLALLALEKAKSCNDKPSLEKAYYQAGSSYDYVNSIDSALTCYKMFLYYATICKDSSGMAKAYNMVGSIYIYKADYPV